MSRRIPSWYTVCSSDPPSASHSHKIVWFAQYSAAVNAWRTVWSLSHVRLSMTS